MVLKHATDEEKLAIDLIMLLENNQIPTPVVLAALDIVRCDYLRKQRMADLK